MRGVLCVDGVDVVVCAGVVVCDGVVVVDDDDDDDDDVCGVITEQDPSLTIPFRAENAASVGHRQQLVYEGRRHRSLGRESLQTVADSADAADRPEFWSLT